MHIIFMSEIYNDAIVNVGDHSWRGICMKTNHYTSKGIIYSKSAIETSIDMHRIKPKRVGYFNNCPAFVICGLWLVKDYVYVDVITTNKDFKKVLMENPGKYVFRFTGIIHEMNENTVTKYTISGISVLDRKHAVKFIAIENL